MRRLATTALTATLLSGGGLAVTATPAAGTAPPSAGVADDNYSLVGAFVERYHGRYIYGWGGTQPCAFIDGVSLELIDHGQNWYSSAVNAYEKTFGVRATTRAAVRSLAGADLQPTEPPAHCRF
ncbi:tyrosinase family oxidase copper chaperone [Micromonospora sp. CPCC 206061]|uniref:tyrosinase family oxidase copper chaperone n=1 Tax=Micromonospora sp. CPCC 206061 TaxID=3122410 RepID=UPI002FEE99A4